MRNPSLPLQTPAFALAAALLAFFASTGAASAHASDRGFVLLLPTGHYILGGALSVAASFLVLLLVAPTSIASLAGLRARLATFAFDGRSLTSLASFALLALLVAAGWWGSRDPLSNPLPLTVWTLFWIGLTLASGVFGNLFAWLDPWRGPAALVSAIVPGRRLDRDGDLPLGYLPAIVQFAAFAWFELVYPAPDDPQRLALAVAAYWAVNFVAVLAFGHERWTRTGECFSVFFRLVSKLSPFDRADGGALHLRPPGGKLFGEEPLPPGGVFFLLFVLGSVSFDGLMRTFAWLAFIGVNPLEFPGRSAVILPNTIGLAATALALASAYLLAVWAGERMAGSTAPFRLVAGQLVWSIVPIALAYHFAHYLIALLVNGQYALVSLSDPFSLGWNLFGTADNYVSAGLVMGPESAWVLWNLQSAAIVTGHVFAVLLAHGLAARIHPGRREAFVSQIPLAVLMILYTVLGLWLLSAPTGA